MKEALPTNIILRNGMGEGQPQIDLDGINFNGDSGNEMDYETLFIKKEELDWSFCKTARKPYDLYVMVVLIAAHEILGYEVSSDGRFDEWKTGIDLYLKTIYDEQPDEEGMKVILPEFLFDGESGDEYEKSYSVFDYIKSLFVVVD